MFTIHYRLVIIIISLLCIPQIAFAVTKELPVPFSSQAPEGIWVEPWRNACEETSMILVKYFYEGKTNVPSIAAIKYDILELVRLENKILGYNKDNTAADMVKMINDYLPFEAYVAKNPTVQQIKSEIDAGRPVIMPAHGRELDNPHYKSDQIDYHVFVIKGYDDDTQEFITQEVATRFGLDYRYKYDTIMNAMHDFLPNDQTHRGAKVAVFTRPNITNLSADSDADEDGLSKADEIKYGTILRSHDSDGDGYTDGEEVKHGYSPTISSKGIKDGDLVKISGDPKIYIVEQGKARHITSMAVLKRHGWDVRTTRRIDPTYLSRHLSGGEPITY